MVSSKNLRVYSSVSTLVKYVGQGPGLPHQKLQAVSRIHAGVDPLYRQVLSAVPRSLSFKRVIGTLILLHRPLEIEVLARELRLDLYRIDLASVVSKYIGETEKNLRRVFDAAEDGGAILFFDECDALFGKRSKVRDSHDRYANIEVNYLLQRIEAYRGLAILATNMRNALDAAFTRRR